MIAFSSDEKVAGNGVYLLSFLAGRDVPRIVSFAMSRGKRNFAELIPQSAYGRIAETAFARAVSSGGGQAAVRATFPPNDSTAMLGPVRQVANAVKSGQRVDALFLPAGRDELPELAPLLASEELSSARVQFIGTGQWDYPNIGGDRALLGGWYPAPDPEGLEQFRAALFQDLWRRAAAHREPRLRCGQPCRVAVAQSPRPALHAPRSSRGRPASPASTACSACCPTAPASAASPSSKCAKAARK